MQQILDINMHMDMDIYNIQFLHKRVCINKRGYNDELAFNHVIHSRRFQFRRQEPRLSGASDDRTQRD